MSKKLLENKNALIAVLSVLLVITGIVTVILVQRNLREAEKSGVNIENEGKDDSNDIGESEPYDGNGLEVMEEDLATEEDTINAPSSWEDSNESSSETDIRDKSDHTNMNDNDKTDVTNKENNSKENDSNEDDENTLDDGNTDGDDEITWGTIF